MSRVKHERAKSKEREYTELCESQKLKGLQKLELPYSELLESHPTDAAPSTGVQKTSIHPETKKHPENEVLGGLTQRF